MRIEGWLGGVYDDFGMYSSKEDADRGILPDSTLDDLLDDFKGKRVSITIVDLDKERKISIPNNPNQRPTKINSDRSIAEMRRKDKELINKIMRL